MKKTIVISAILSALLCAGIISSVIGYLHWYDSPEEQYRRWVLSPGGQAELKGEAEALKMLEQMQLPDHDHPYGNLDINNPEAQAYQKKLDENLKELQQLQKK